MRRDADDYERQPKPKSSLLWLWILLGLGGIGAVLLVGLIVVGAGFWMLATPSVATPVSSAAPVVTESLSATMTRDEFKAAVLGKTPQEVIAVVGQPDRDEEYEGQRTWYYNNRTTDPGSGKVDASARVMWRNGRVEEVAAP